MAGDPAPLHAVQAAVMKSAAGKAGQSDAPPTTGSVFEGAIAQDLAVMADQAKGYSAGAALGNAEAENQRSMASSRMAQEAAQAEAARSRRMQLEQMQTQAAQLRLSQQGQEGQIRLRDMDRRAQEEIEAAKGSPEDRAQERATENARRIKQYAAANESLDFADTFDLLTQQATTYREFMDIYDQYATERPNELLGADDRAKVSRYARTYYDSVTNGKPLRINRLKAVRTASDKNNNRNTEPESSGGGGPSLVSRARDFLLGPLAG